MSGPRQPSCPISCDEAAVPLVGDQLPLPAHPVPYHAVPSRPSPAKPSPARPAYQGGRGGARGEARGTRGGTSGARRREATRGGSRCGTPRAPSTGSSAPRSSSERPSPPPPQLDASTRTRSHGPLSCSEVPTSYLDPLEPLLGTDQQGRGAAGMEGEGRRGFGISPDDIAWMPLVSDSGKPYGERQERKKQRAGSKQAVGGPGLTN